MLKTNATLMGKMLIALWSRDGNLDDFFASEIQSYATSLSDFRKLHLPAKKSEIVDLLLHDEIENLPSTYHGKILDGAAIVHMLKTGTATTFAQYSESVFIPYVQKCIQSVQRVDIVWDQYKQDSLKADTREKRGKLKGIRRKVAASTKLPGNWQDFLKDDTNKEELFSFSHKCSLLSHLSWGKNGGLNKRCCNPIQSGFFNATLFPRRSWYKNVFSHEAHDWKWFNNNKS